MPRFVLVLLLALLPLASHADDTPLERLDTLDDGRAWEAVGRLDLGHAGFCTGALIAPNLVLTAAHCLYEPVTGHPVSADSIEFMAGFRNGRASAYRQVRRAVVHPDYVPGEDLSAGRVQNDVALLELQHPIRNTTITPFLTATRPRKGARIGIVSYAHDRADAPSLQEVCHVMGRQQGVLVMSCEVDFGSSGAPVFSFEGGIARIVSVVSAKAEVQGQRVSLGTDLDAPLARLLADLSEGAGFDLPDAPQTARISIGGGKTAGGAKFVKP